MAKDLFREQVDNLQLVHFLVLFWVADAEDKGVRYNITNCFDDLKGCRVTRTKQTAVAVTETLRALCFLVIREEGNRKHMYITEHGAKALEMLVLRRAFTPQPSAFLEAD